jgi:uncharacterized protein (DUF2132 family)
MDPQAELDSCAKPGKRQSKPLVPSADMPTPQARNPLHGITLEAMLNELVAHFGWPELGYQIHIRCFVLDPSVASSLKFLRKTPWAREKVESLYLFMRREQARMVKKQPPTDLP